MAGIMLTGVNAVMDIKAITVPTSKKYSTPVLYRCVANGVSLLEKPALECITAFAIVKETMVTEKRKSLKIGGVGHEETMVHTFEDKRSNVCQPKVTFWT